MSSSLLSVIVNDTNATINSTTDQSTDKLVALTIIAEVFCLFITVVGVIGNVFVLSAFLTKWTSLKTYEWFIVSLAVADLLGTFMYPIVQFHEISGGSFKPIGSLGCNIIHFLASASIYVSSLTLVMVSVDRFVAVKFPFMRRGKMCRILIFTSWSLGGVFASVHILDGSISLVNTNNGDQWICRFAGSDSAYARVVILSFTMQLVVPFIVMSILYTYIVYRLYKNTDKTVKCVSEDEIHRRRQYLRKTTKLLIVVVIVFFTCVTPYHVFVFLYLFGTHGLHGSPHTVPIMLSLLMLMMANSCVNPLIYGKFLRSFQKFLLVHIDACFRFVKTRNEIRNPMIPTFREYRVPTTDSSYLATHDARMKNADNMLMHCGDGGSGVGGGRVGGVYTHSNHVYIRKHKRNNNNIIRGRTDSLRIILEENNNISMEGRYEELFVQDDMMMNGNMGEKICDHVTSTRDSSESSRDHRDSGNETADSIDYNNVVENLLARVVRETIL